MLAALGDRSATGHGPRERWHGRRLCATHRPIVRLGSPPIAVAHGYTCRTASLTRLIASSSSLFLSPACPRRRSVPADGGLLSGLDGSAFLCVALRNDLIPGPFHPAEPNHRQTTPRLPHGTFPRFPNPPRGGQGSERSGIKQGRGLGANHQARPPDFPEARAGPNGPDVQGRPLTWVLDGGGGCECSQANKPPPAWGGGREQRTQNRMPSPLVALPTSEFFSVSHSAIFVDDSDESTLFSPSAALSPEEGRYAVIGVQGRKTLRVGFCRRLLHMPRHTMPCHAMPCRRERNPDCPRLSLSLSSAFAARSPRRPAGHSGPPPFHRKRRQTERGSRKRHAAFACASRCRRLTYRIGSASKLPSQLRQGHRPPLHVCPDCRGDDGLPMRAQAALPVPSRGTGTWSHGRE